MKSKMLAFMIGWLLSFALTAQAPQSLIGTWKDQANPEKQIQMYRQPNGKIWGKSVTTNQTVKRELTVFKDLEWDDRAKAYTGTLINPDNGSEFRIAVNLTGPNQFEFTVKRFFLSRTFRFTRVD